MDRLPAEIHLQIFENLSYGDLHHRIPLVSKRFHSLLQSSPKSATIIDKLLFRDAPKRSTKTDVEETSTTATHTINPVLETLVYEYSTNITTIGVNGIRNEWGDVLSPGAPLYQHPIKDENAFCPAVREAVYHHPWLGLDNDFIHITGTGINGGSVTVLDVMKAAVEIASRCKDAIPQNMYEIVGAIWEGLGKVEVVGGCLHVYDKIQRQDFHR